MKESDPAQHSVWKNLLRIAGETKAPIKQLLLKKVGLAVHDLRLHVENSASPLQIQSTLWNDLSLLNDRYWRVPLQPCKISIRCVSTTNPVVSGVVLFAEIPTPFDDFVFLDNPSSYRSKSITD